MNKNIEMPPRIAALEQDKRGYPIPWNVARGKDGAPIFTANDNVRHHEAIRQGLCPICGDFLVSECWFVGGPKSAFHDRGAYIDLPGHIECEEYALQVCPYLSVKNYGTLIDQADFVRKRMPGQTAVVNTTQDPNRPTVFTSVKSRGIVVTGDSIIPYCKPDKILQAKFWRHGEVITHADAINLIEEEDGPEFAQTVFEKLKAIYTGQTI